MTPLAHAVRLVHHEKAHGAREEVVEEVAVLESLRREIENLALALEDPPRGLSRLTRREMRVHGECVHAVRLQLVLLVLHQRDERAHDDRQPLQHQGRQLVDDRLAASRGHDDERVATAEDGANGLPLPTTKIGMPEAIAERGDRLRARRAGWHGPGKSRKCAHAFTAPKEVGRGGWSEPAPAAPEIRRAYSAFGVVSSTDVRARADGKGPDIGRTHDAGSEKPRPDLGEEREATQGFMVGRERPPTYPTCAGSRRSRPLPRRCMSPNASAPRMTPAAMAENATATMGSGRQ